MALQWQPGLIALHGNQTEVLADTVLAWLAANPLDVLEPEVVLVQSNGMAEWFKMRMAEQLGVCASARVELPARFVWRSYRQILGRQAVPRHSPLDKTPMTWRLMRLLPACLDQPGFEPVAGFLRPGEPQRLLQLAERLADLYDQYQIYRADWLDAWAEGRYVLTTPGRPDVALPEDQQWQALLWRAVLQELDAQDRSATRPALHLRALSVLQSEAALAAPLARRVVVFGMSQMPLSLLQFLSAVARHSQVLLAVPNPCRFHWIDAIDGRELLRRQRQSRHPLRQGRDLSVLPLQAMHAHAHPLLAAWGRQSRDYVAQLEAFDETTTAAAALSMPRVDLFEEQDADELAHAPLLVQVQQRIRDLLPLAEHPRLQVPASDRSVVFHTAHSMVRELEVLHDQLLQALAQAPAPGQARLAPRDVVVMLPSIATAAPSIRAVFGQYGRHDARYIPFDIADLSARSSSPLVVAVQWLLRLPQQRCRLSELCDLLDVPALAARLDLAAEDLPQLTQWMAGAGIRWGLNADQRGHLGLQACGDANSAWFGLQRMLLGYASGGQALAQAQGTGSSAVFEGIEPYDEVAGLSAGLAGVLASLLERLLQWWRTADEPATAAVWAQRFRSLLADLFDAQDDGDQALLAALHEALTQWQEACDQAQFVEAVPLEVAQEAWMQTLEQPRLEQRFRAGGVTFCTLMPMRAIPFEVVCLLGMNDGDYPRQVLRSDFDLMALAGQHRPGDRARRDDDRQLMLDALLAARRQLYISWTGHHVRDNSEQPASVLVAQLRDYLAAGWLGEGTADLGRTEQGQALLAQRTQQHLLQPFSRRYFEQDSAWHTYAREWRAAHLQAAAQTDRLALPAFEPDPKLPLTLGQLTEFLRHPAKAFLRHRLQVRFEWDLAAVEDDEVFDLDGLAEYGLVQGLQQQVMASMQAGSPACLAVGQRVDAEVARLARCGQLPLAGLGERQARRLSETVTPALQAWLALVGTVAEDAPRQLIHIPYGEQSAWALDDWLEGLYCPPPSLAHTSPWGAVYWRQLDPRTLLDARGGARVDKLLSVYVYSLALAACDVQACGWLIGRDAALCISPMDSAQAQGQLQGLMALWLQGQDMPLPLPLRTAMAAALAQAASPEGPAELGTVQAVYDGAYMRTGEGEDPSWARCYADFEALCADGQFLPLALQVYEPMRQWAQQCVEVLTLEAVVALGGPSQEKPA